MTSRPLCSRHPTFAIGFCPICKMEADKELRRDAAVPGLAAIVERLETVRTSMIRDHGRLTPQAILDVQGVLNDLNAALTRPVRPELLGGNGPHGAVKEHSSTPAARFVTGLRAERRVTKPESRSPDPEGEP